MLLSAKNNMIIALITNYQYGTFNIDSLIYTDIMCNNLFFKIFL